MFCRAVVVVEHSSDSLVKFCNWFQFCNRDSSALKIFLDIFNGEPDQTPAATIGVRYLLPRATTAEIEGLDGELTHQHRILVSLKQQCCVTDVRCNCVDIRCAYSSCCVVRTLFVRNMSGLVHSSDVCRLFRCDNLCIILADSEMFMKRFRTFIRT
jgi:hypothetical protein